MTNLPVKREHKKISSIILKTETINPHKKGDTFFLYIDISSINRLTLKIENPKKILGKNAPSRAKREIKKGDIAFATTRPTLKNIAICNFDNENIVASTGFCILRTKESTINKYLFYYLISNLFQKRIERFIKGAQYPAISDKNLKSIEIPLPPLSTQKAIVAKLDEISASIEKAKGDIEKQIEKVDAFEASQVGSIIDNLNCKEIDFGDICHFVRGPFGGSLKKEIFKKSGFAIYEQRNAINDQFIDIRYFINEDKFKEMIRFELKPNDLIMSCSGTMGKISIVPDDIKKGIINQALLKLTPSKLVSSRFLQLWMQSNSFQKKLEELSQGAAIKNVASVKILKKIQVPLLDLEEQKNLVKQINIIQSKCKTIRSYYQKQSINYENLRASTLDKVFSGKLV